MRRRSPLIPFFTALVAPTLAHAEDNLPIPAQTVPPANATERKDAATPVVVTADRRETAESRSTASVSRVDASDDRERGYVLNAWQWLVGLPGVDAVAANGGIDGGIGRVRIRGANSFDTQWLVDGIPVSDPSTPQGNLPVNFLPTAGLDAMEVVRGPQSGLYGNNAAGGVVNLITVRPTSDHQSLLRAEAGSFGTVRGIAQATGPLSKSLGYAVAIDGLHSDGFSALTDADAHGDAKQHEADGLDRLGANGRLEWQIHDSTRCYLASRYQALNQEFDGYLAPDSRQPHSQTRILSTSVGSRSRLERNLTLDTDVSWSTSQRDYHPATTTQYDGDQRRAALVSRYQAQPWLEVAIGGDATRNALTTETATTSEDHEDWLGGGWIQLYSAGALHDLSLSTRHDLHSRVGDATTWRAAGALHLLDQRLTTRAAVGTAFRAPSLSEQYGFGGSEALKPQKSLGYEVGMRLQPVPGVALESTYFVNDYDQLIGFSNSLFAYANVHDYRTHGIENALELNGWDDHLILRGAYTWQEVDQIPGDVDDNYTPYQPEHLFSAAAILRGEPGWMRVGFTRRGAAPASIYDSTTGTAWASIVDVAAGMALGRHWEISARVDNVFDEAYEVTPGYATSGLAAYGGVAARF